MYLCYKAQPIQFIYGNSITKLVHIITTVFQKVKGEWSSLLQPKSSCNIHGKIVQVSKL